MSEDDQPYCGEQGPPPAPGLLGYRCTEGSDHQGMHIVTGDDGRVLDTWPRSEALL